MKSIFSSRRNKSPHNNEEAEKTEASFFSKESKTPFFKGSNGLGVQTKLTVGQPGDKYEKEADSMADAVVNNSSKPEIQNKEISSIQRESLATPQEDEKLGTAEQRMEEDKLVQEKPEIQKMEAPEEEMVSKMEGNEEEKEIINKKEEEHEEELVSKKEGEEEEKLQQKSNSANQTASNGLSQQIKSKSGKGKSLSKNTKAEMESSFGTDFSDVNIHTDTDSVKMNKELGAQAFTHGKDVYFNSGKYNPETTSGKHLLAHELTHVVQQNRHLQNKTIQRYRSKEAFNFNTDPNNPKKKNTGSLQEDSFNKKKDKDKKPWIEKIFIHFDGIAKDDDGDWMPTGSLFAMYYPNAVMPIDFFPGPFGVSFPFPKFISFPITGGKYNEGYTDAGNFKVTRIEGVGYNDMPFSKLEGEGPRQKYAKDLSSSMSYAIFFKGGQAIHSGSLDTGSHACVHVDWGKGKDDGDTTKLQMLNYHSVKGLTKVIVTYDTSILPKLCCEKHKHEGRKKGRGPNPCNKIKAESC